MTDLLELPRTRTPRPDWYDHAGCRGVPHLMFPRTETEAAVAVQLCTDCPVQPECLAHALTHGELFGVWGGLTEYERDRIRRRRVVVAVTA